MSFADGHSRQFGNSIYYTAFRNGAFHKADGTVKTIRWQPLTETTPKDIRNIRPMILNKDGYRTILWQRGRFKSFTDYTLDTVGIIEKGK